MFPMLLEYCLNQKQRIYSIEQAKKFGISATGIMGVNCASIIEFYKRNNAFTTILTLIMFRILNMNNKKRQTNIKRNNS